MGSLLRQREGNRPASNVILSEATAAATGGETSPPRLLLTGPRLRQRELVIHPSPLKPNPPVPSPKPALTYDTILDKPFDDVVNFSIGIIAKGHYTERAASSICRDIVNVVNICHFMGVMHRDLKPENFLLATKDEDALLKTTDFGLSVFIEEGAMSLP
ncbi:hypothetical protein IEQ34_011696 [Dendrobium chrysotoxum]|uniref:Protein kinase domain-containing protein n=1 Tax=Dendrobium chrysotoxum TaxID=161865 RepID=A0AAV7GTL8_DENCH|nr:hypothetical protein IEQ34_011696 [Dendrobium chrysotoxum]